MKTRTLISLVLPCVWAAYPQDQPPPKRATVTFVGQGGKPIQVIDEGGKSETVDQKDIRPLNVPPVAAPARSTEPESAAANESPADEAAATDPTLPAPGEPAKEEEQPPDATLLKQLIEAELRAGSVPTLKGTKRGVATTRELTPKEKAILDQVRSDIQNANTPRLAGAKADNAPAAKLSPEQQALREKLVRDLQGNATPQLPDRDRGRANSRTTKGEDQKDFSTPLPAHLLTQPPPQLPDKNKDKKKS